MNRQQLRDELLHGCVDRQAVKDWLKNNGFTILTEHPTSYIDAQRHDFSKVVRISFGPGGKPIEVT
jgi:hypothetical protein